MTNFLFKLIDVEFVKLFFGLVLLVLLLDLLFEQFDSSLFSFDVLGDQLVFRLNLFDF